MVVSLSEPASSHPKGHRKSLPNQKQITILFLRVPDKATTPHRKMTTLERIVMDSSTLIKNMHKALKEMGHELPLGHMYEALAKANGHKSWNVAKSKNVSMEIAPSTRDGHKYEAKMVCTAGDLDSEIQIKKYYYFDAIDHKSALEIMREFVDYRTEEVGYDDLRHSETERLANLETQGDFWYKGWEVITNDTEPDIEIILNLETMTEE